MIVESAMVLTEQEWFDLSVIATFYLINAVPDPRVPSNVEDYERKKKLAERVVEAASS